VSLTERWDRWWFAEADPRNLALLRIGYGLLCLWTVFVIWPDRQALLGDPGVLPLELRNYGWHRPSLFALVEDPTALLVVFVLAALLLSAGVFSRFSMLICWVFVVSVGHRNGMWTDGSDAVMRVFGAYMLLMPLGQVWSVDSLWRRGVDFVLGWPLRLFQLNLCLVYVKTGLVKAPNPTWADGTAVFYSLASPSYWRFPMEELLTSPVVHWVSTLMSYGTLVIELGFPLVLLRRCRRWVLLAGLGLHLGIFAFMRLGAFSEAILWAYLAFVVLERPPLQRAAQAGPTEALTGSRAC